MTKNKNKINLFKKSFLLFKLIVDWKKIIVGTIVTNKNVTIHCKLFQGSLSFKVHSEHFNWSLEETLGGETDIFVFSVVDMLNISVWWLTKRRGWQQTPKFSFKPLITDTYILFSYSKVAALETSQVRVVCNGPGSKDNIEIFWQQINRTGSRDWGWTRWPLKLQFDKDKTLTHGPPSFSSEMVGL